MLSKRTYSESSTGADDIVSGDPMEKRIKQFYNRGRYQKLYGELTKEARFECKEFFVYLGEVSAAHRSVSFAITAFWFTHNDLGIKNKQITFSKMAEIIADLIKKGCKIWKQPNPPGCSGIKFLCRGDAINWIMPELQQFHSICVESSSSSGILTGARISDVSYQNRIAATTLHNRYFTGTMASPIGKMPDAIDFDALLDLCEFIHPWVQGRGATLQRYIIGSDGKPELRFYRHDYSLPEPDLLFLELEDLERQIARGAFCFIADSHTPDFKGISWITIDLDPQQTPYDQQRGFVQQFIHFLSDWDIRFYLCHSGNNSFHFRIPIAAPEPDEQHFLLPRPIHWSTFTSRRADEMPITYVRDAAELCSFIFRETIGSAGDAVVCRIPCANHKSPYRIVFDNRTQIHGGARIPGSFHSKSRRYSILIPSNVPPQSRAEVDALCDIAYILEHPEYLAHPSLTERMLMDNKRALFSLTDGYLARNMDRLIHDEKIFTY